MQTRATACKPNTLPDTTVETKQGGAGMTHKSWHISLGSREKSSLTSYLAKTAA